MNPTTVKRWVDGGEIPPVMLKVLAWVLFGEAPQRLKTPVDLQTTLEFEDDEWKTIEAMARREGTTPALFIAGRIRAYLSFERASDEPPHLRSIEPSGNPSQRSTRAGGARKSEGGQG